MVATVSAADLKARYPEFDGVDDDLVTEFIAEAAPMVDDGWEVADQKPGIMSLAAHLLSQEGYPRRVTNPGSFNPNTSGRQMLSRKVGDVSVQYAQTTRTGDSLRASLGSSVYGQRFARLMKLNAPAIGLV